MQEPENEKVSIGVPVYNVEPFLDTLVNSIMNQTYCNLEIILVDDGSIDDSGKICDAYAKKDSRIIVFHQLNAGVSAARNKILSVASGEWLTFVDGDDWLEPDFVAYMLRLVHETHSDMAMSLNTFTTRDRNQVKNDIVETWGAERAVCTMLYPYLAIGCWNKIYSLHFIRKNNLSFTHALSGEGMVFIVTAAQHANHIGVGQRKVYNYRLNNENSAMTKHRLEMGLYAQKAINKIKNELILRTPAVISACDWHIWKNYNYILFLIIATDSKAEHRQLYDDCMTNIRRKLLPVLVRSPGLRLRTKCSNLLQGLFPVWFAKRRLRIEKAELEKDLAEWRQ